MGGVWQNIESMNRVKVDIVAGQETWDNHRGEGGFGLLVRECIAEELEMLGMRSVWMKV